MTVIGAIMDKVMRRGLYKAYVGDRLIMMCQDCKNNATETGVFKSAPVHRCLGEWALDGKNRVIVDPYSVPGWCPHRIVDIIEPAVAR
jgi:hypothetical protein